MANAPSDVVVAFRPTSSTVTVAPGNAWPLVSRTTPRNVSVGDGMPRATDDVASMKADAVATMTTIRRTRSMSVVLEREISLSDARDLGRSAIAAALFARTAR